jgi:hypothetical protein
MNVKITQNNGGDRAELQERRFGDTVVRTWKRSDGNWNFAPWLFAIQKDGEGERSFTGVPNYCESRHVALMRGWYRAKWLNEGKYYKHYSSPYNGPLPCTIEVTKEEV